MKTILLLLLCSLFVRGWAAADKVHLKRKLKPPPIGIPLSPSYGNCATSANILNVSFDRCIQNMSTCSGATLGVGIASMSHQYTFLELNKPIILLDHIKMADLPPLETIAL